MSDQEANIKRFVISALHQGCLAKGVHEVCKALDTKQAKLCILAEDCTEGFFIYIDNYKKIVKALCKENKVPIVTIPLGASLGEYIGICKYDSQNTVRKPRKCSSVILKDFPADVTEEEAAAFLASLK